MAAQLLERLPANGADLGSAVWTVRDDGWLDDHPLTWAIRRDTGALRVLLHARMSPNTVVGTNLPLFTAAASRRLGALAILLEWKAEVNARLPSDTTPLFAAVVVQSPACVRLLLQSGARADVHPLGFLGYIQIRPSCRTALSDYCEIVSGFSRRLRPTIPWFRAGIFLSWSLRLMSRQAIGFSSSCCMYGCGGTA